MHQQPTFRLHVTELATINGPSATSLVHFGNNMLQFHCKPFPTGLTIWYGITNRCAFSWGRLLPPTHSFP